MGFNKPCWDEVVVVSVSKDVAMTRQTMTISLTPKVSVVIPAYNVAKYIIEALNSVFAQTYTNYEVIVINDGSSDTEELEVILKPYQKKIVYLKQENQGAASARNAGIKNARGELIAFLDADDLWFPDFLESQTAFLQKNKLDMVWCDAYLFGDSPCAGRTFMQMNPSIEKITIENLLHQKYDIITSGTVARKDVLLAVNGFDDNIFRGHDYDLWVRLLFNNARLGYQKKIMLKYRLRSDSLSGNEIQMTEREINVYNQITKNLNLKEEHKKIIENQLNRLHSRLMILHGKVQFVNRDFKSALNNFKSANLLHYSFKLNFIILILNIAPNFFLYIYNIIRKNEVKFLQKKN